MSRRRLKLNWTRIHWNGGRWRNEERKQQQQQRRKKKEENKWKLKRENEATTTNETSERAESRWILSNRKSGKKKNKKERECVWERRSRAWCSSYRWRGEDREWASHPLANRWTTTTPQGGEKEKKKKTSYRSATTWKKIAMMTSARCVRISKWVQPTNNYLIPYF